MNLDQEKRVMIAFALSIVMLILYRIYFVKEQPPEPKKAAPAAAATHSCGPAGSAHDHGHGASSATAPIAAPAAAALPVLQGAKPEEIVVENKLLPRDLFHPGGSGQELGAEELSRREGPTARYRQCSGM